MQRDRGPFRKFATTLAKAAGVFFILAIVAFFSFRNMLLQRALDKVAAKFRNDYQTTFTTGSASFSGLTGVEIHDISIVPDGRDTLVHIGTLESSIRFWYALILDYRLKELVLKDGYIHLVKNAQGRNIDVFLKHERKDSVLAESSASPSPNEMRTNYARLGYDLISRILAQVPNKMLVENFALKITEDQNFVAFHMQELSLKEEQLDSRIEVTGNSFVQHWNIVGKASTKGRNADVSFFTSDTGMVRIPYIDQRFHLVTGFDSIRMNLSSVEMEGDQLEIKGFASVTNLLVNHRRISKKDVVIGRAEIDYRYIVGPDFISLDSATTVRLNKMFFHPFVKYQQSPDTVYSLGVVIPKMLAQDFISSLPEGLFTHFKGMEAEGQFEYRLDFAYNTNMPQDLLFESTLRKEGLKILKYGEANLSKLNGDFVYTPMENGRAQRSILVGAANPDYTPLDQLSVFVKKAILTTEDPSFFYHRGFIDEAFRQSIIKNIKTRKFARGASTISMQLVKNVFLTREKTLSRKLEEILLVYILENNHLVSKERMFEVYVNIIEWGPNVYGIGEASQFYFRKRPSELSLKESLFLASIIPRPKGFMWRFGKDGNIREFATRQFTFLADLMIRRTLILPEDTVGLSATPLLITGPAKKFIIKTDTIVNDSIIMDEDGLMDEE